MSFFISSEDATSGTAYDGIWTLSSSLQGTYSVTSQTMSVQTFPWMWEGVDTLDIRTTTYLLRITFPPAMGQNENYTGATINYIQETFQNGFTAAALINSAYGRTVTTTYANGSFTVTFSSGVDLHWESTHSTIGPVFGKAKVAEIGVTTLIIPTKYMTTSVKFLECDIAESSNQIATAHGTLPTILFSTADAEFTGQQVTIRRSTNTLNIKLYRFNIPYPIPILGTWNLILAPV